MEVKNAKNTNVIVQTGGNENSHVPKMQTMRKPFIKHCLEDQITTQTRLVQTLKAKVDAQSVKKRQ